METWKPVLNYENIYEVSSLGRVCRSDGYHTIKKYLKAAANHHGYLNVSLSKHATCRTIFVHKLVCEAFHGGRKDGMTINHINGIKIDNRSENLEYLTHAENMAHALNTINTIRPTRARGGKNGSILKPNLLCRGEAHKSSKLNDAKVQEVRRLLSEGIQQRLVADQFDISQTQIWRIKAGLSWAHVP